ncbi:MAG TPA: alpha/beta hydrolase [Egibacteraceae bacterium]|nr:alpha/beta hydrolase [Egibacteraceae bacterium]
MDPPVWQQRQLTVRGRVVAWREAGDGPAVLYLHDAGADTLASPAFDDVATDHRVLVVDLPGYGRSDPAAGLHAPAAVAALLADIIEATVEGPVVAAGTSLGGWFAATLAAERPDLVAGLLLANAAGMHAPPHYLFDLFAAGAAAATTNHHVAQALVARLPDDERVGETTPAPVATAVVAPWVQNLAAAAAASWSHAVASPEMIGAAGRIRCPTIVLWGEHDGLIPMEHGRVWAASIPGARLRVVRGAGHLVALDAPDELAAAIRALTG